MMKKLLIALALVLVIVILTATTAAAAEVNDVPLGVYSVVTDDEGSETMRGAPDKNEMENAQEYELYVDRKEVLSVGVSGNSDKRFHVEFMLPDTTNEVYLTGLCADNVESVQQAILDRYIEGEPFDFYDLDFIDAEKLIPENYDSNLCWAASCANMLVYTGWAQRAGFADEDAVFDLYADSYSNDGGFQRDGIAWFFNGVSLEGNDYFSMKPTVIDYPNSGGYFNNYAYDTVCNYERISSVTQLNNMEERLKNGCGISPGIGIFQNGTQVGSHAITLWGFVTDVSRDKNDITRFRNVFITDSDSDMTQPNDRSLSDNIMNMMPVYSNGNGIFCFNYTPQVSAVFQDYTYLLPYSSSLPREKDLTTMRNKTKYPDLDFGQVTLSEKLYEVEQATLHESGTKLYFGFYVENASDKNYRSSVNVKRNVVNEKGKTFLNDSINVSRFLLSQASSTDTYYGELSNLPAGDYKLTLKVNENHPVTEAYYYNNTYTIDFKVRDSYILGDCNKDGLISIGDVTQIQRLIAGMYDDDKAAERGNVDGGALDIKDATMLQKYLARFKVDEPICTKRLHTII